jgi:hypothetical protein
MNPSIDYYQLASAAVVVVVVVVRVYLNNQLVKLI